MPHSKWISAAQYVTLSKHDKIWADNLLMGRLTAEHGRDVRDISNTDYCVVGVLHNCDGTYGLCDKCTSFSNKLNKQYINRNIEGYGTKQFREILGKFLAHYEKQHYAKRERDITKCR